MKVGGRLEPSAEARPRRALIVLTPATEARQQLAATLVRQARPNFAAAELAIAREPAALRRRVAEFDPDLLIAAGGDGTVNLALTALRERDGLAVVPLGLANDLARSLALVGDPANHDTLGSLAVTRSERRDLLRFDERAVLTTGGLGLPAEVIRRLEQVRSGPAAERVASLGARIYPVLATELCLRGPPLYRFDLAWTEPGGRTRVATELRSHGLFVCNQPRFAGAMAVAPAADPCDGQFELAILHARGRRGLLAALAGLVVGEVPPGSVEVVRATAASIRCDRPLRWFGDGELLGKGAELAIALEPGAVRLWS